MCRGLARSEFLDTGIEGHEYSATLDSCLQEIGIGPLAMASNARHNQLKHRSNIRGHRPKFVAPLTYCLVEGIERVFGTYCATRQSTIGQQAQKPKLRQGVG